MSGGPIEIQPYPHNSLLESSQKQYDLKSEQEFSSSQIEPPPSDTTLINPGLCRGHFRQKRSLNSDHYHAQADLPYHDDLNLETDRFKRFRAQANFQNLTHSAPQTSSIFVKPQESNNIENSDFLITDQKPLITKRSSSNSSFAVYHENIDEPTSEANFSQSKPYQSLPNPCQSSQANEITETIIESMKQAQSLDQARHSINTLLNEMNSKFESRINEILHVERKAYDKLTETKFREISHERDNSTLKVNTLIEQLQSERQESMVKDQKIDELQKSLSETQASMDQIKASIEAYLKNQSLWVYKGCGLNERFPPDVY